MTGDILSNFLWVRVAVAIAMFAIVAGAGQKIDDDMPRNMGRREQAKGQPRRSMPRPPVFKRKSPPIPARLSAAAPWDAKIGFTVWQWRPSRPADPVRKVLRVREKDREQDIEMTPVRLDASTPIPAGSRLRLSIETPRTGYLYIIDRERYGDGSYGDASLIFPAPGDDNRVAAGRMTIIPGTGSRDPYFQLLPGGPKHVGDELIILVTPAPLNDLMLTERKIELTPEQVEQLADRVVPETERIVSRERLALLEKEWSKPVERHELVGGAGATATEVEEAAAANASATLTDVDPLPQVIYRIAAKPGDPLLIKVLLRLGN